MASNYGRAPSVFYDSSMASYWENQTYVGTANVQGADAASLGGSQVQVVFTRTEAVGVREDVSLFTLAMYTESGGAPPTAFLSAANAATVEGFLDTFITAIRSYLTPHWVHAGYVWRNFRFDGPISSKTGHLLPGPAWRTTSRSVAGNGVTTYAPDQVAASVTLDTASRKHWGRFYMPGPPATQFTAYGRFSTTYVDALAGSVDALFNSMGTNATVFVPIVWSPQYRGMLTLVAAKVDDVPDVIRRRRSKIKTYEKRYNNTA